MINPNNITNVSFAASPALQAILNANGVKPINAVNSATPVTTDSYLVQQQSQTPALSMQAATAEAKVVTAPLEFTPKTDVYEPMHKKGENKKVENQKSAGKTVAKTAGIGIAVVLAAVLFAPKLAKALLSNVDASQPLVKSGKDMLSKENVKLAVKKTANLIEHYEKKIASSKTHEFVKAQAANVTSAFKKDGAVSKGISSITSAFKKDGAVGAKAEKLLVFFKKASPGA